MEKNYKETIILKSILVEYIRHWKFFLITFVISFIPAILYLTFVPLTFMFDSAIQLVEEKESGLGSLGLGEASGIMKSFGIGGGGGGAINIDDELIVMSSNNLLRKVALDLGLNISYSKPFSLYYLYDDSPLFLSGDSIIINNIDDEYRFDVNVLNGVVNVKAKTRFGGDKETFSFSTLPAKMKIADKEFTLDFNPSIMSSDKSYKLKIKCVPASWTAEELSNKIKIEDISATSRILLLTTTDHSKNRGKDILNALVMEYNNEVKANKHVEDYKTIDFVDSRINEIVSSLKEKEQEIEIYKRQNKLTLLDADVKLYGEVMKDIQRDIIDMESQSRIIDMLDDYIRKPENKYNIVPPIMSAVEGEKGSSLSKYNEALIERNRLLQNSSEINPIFKMVDQRVEKLREGVFVMIDNTRSGCSKSLASLKSKESELMSKMRSVPEQERQYISLKRDQEILQAQYLLLLQKKEETMMSLGNPNDRARIIEPVYIKKKTVGPRKLFAAVGMLVFTLMIPVAFIYSRKLFISIKDEYVRIR
jgi:uncharacterized protein involved in exopolysaccharide biosynthesis